MTDRRVVLKGAASLIPIAVFAGPAVEAKSIAETLNELGPEGEALAAQVGTWTVVETVWPSPGADPIITKGVAVRRMIGPLLQEFHYSADDPSEAAIDRIDYLSFNRVEGRWNYVSMDVRAPVGIMAANSFERDPAARIHVVFNPFALPGEGAAVSGPLLRMDQIIETLDARRNRKDQHFIVADGSGTKWLAHRYEYSRRE